jgi:GNAT superfamily N-acetyltransferase
VALKLGFRPVRARDRERVAGICSRTWGGWDYVMLFFDGWVREPGFLGVEAGGRLVGFGKATELAPREWWLEGLRMDTAWRGRGIATALSRKVLADALDRRPRSLRLATAEVNTESLRIIRAMGFEELFRTRLFVGKPPGSSTDSGVVRVGRAEAGQFLVGSQELCANRGLVSYTWLFRRLTPAHLRELQQQDALWGVRVRGRLEGLAVCRPHRYRSRDLELSFFGGTDRARAGLRRALGRRARQSGAKQVSAMAASGPMRAALAELGMKPHPRLGETIVFEYPL